MYQKIKSEIEKSLAHIGENGQKVTLIGVSKTRSAADIEVMFQQGVQHFGENYVQEALSKKALLSEEVRETICWHLIGPLQSNKAKLVAGEFDWIQTVSTIKLARLLNQHRPEDMAPLNICIQVNIDESPTKNGLAANATEICQFLESLVSYRRLALRGMMIMPDSDSVACTQLKFKRGQALFNEVKSQLSPEIAGNFDTLSMGMSGDFALAIEAGSTMVRIGTALFGPRQY